MYLLDFCYAASLATLVFLCLPPELCDPRLEAAVYALADGPVSGSGSIEATWPSDRASAN